MIDEAGFYIEVGRRIRFERELRGWTQDMLAAKVELTRSSISNIEAGRQKMMLYSVSEIAFALGISPSRLLPSSSVLSKESGPLNLGNVNKSERKWIESPAQSVQLDEE